MKVSGAASECGYTNTSSMVKAKSDESNVFSKILEQKASSNMSTKQFISTLEPDELYVLQKANHLASSIKVDMLSDEGADNLLLMPQGSDKAVDLNNDGIVEVGCAKEMVFPLPNAPSSVKTAWKEATAEMSSEDSLHIMEKILKEQIEKNAYRNKDGSWSIHKSGEAGWVNIFGTTEESYQQLFEKIINKIDHPLAARTSEQIKGDDHVKDILTDFINKLKG